MKASGKKILGNHTFPCGWDIPIHMQVLTLFNCERGQLFLGASSCTSLKWKVSASEMTQLANPWPLNACVK